MTTNIKLVLKKLYSKYKEKYSYIPNVNKTKHKKNVLISYLTFPFIYRKNQHTHEQESIAIAEVFDALEYNVDIYDCRTSIKIDYSKYDCIFGFGFPLTNSFYNNYRKNQKIIYYGTGMHIFYQNTATLSRVHEVFKKKGILIPESGRVVPYTWSEQTSLVDAMILLGNNTVAETYKKYYSGPIFTQHTSYYERILLDDALEKNWKQAQKHFLWFGSVGAIHKGLDLLLDIFPSLPEYHLHICGLNPKEKRFTQAYKNELKSPNIHNHGFVNIYSQTYKNLIKTCAYVILPSCSEAQATSLINTICNGLIPVTTKYCGIDQYDFIFPIKSLSASGIMSTMDDLKNISPEKCAQLAQDCLSYTRQQYSIESYKQELLKNLIHIL